MRSFEGSWSAPVAGLVVMITLAGGCAGSVGSAPLVRGDSGLAGDAGAGWPVVIEPRTEDRPPVIAERFAHDLCTDVGGCPSPVDARPGTAPDATGQLAVPAPAPDQVLCTTATDCASGRCVRGVCTTGRAGDPCDVREHCETFCNLATHRCGDLCVDPLACR